MNSKVNLTSLIYTPLSLHFNPKTFNGTPESFLNLKFLFFPTIAEGTEECPVKSVVNRVAVQLAKALQNKGMALLVNHGISEEKV